MLPETMAFVVGMLAQVFVFLLWRRHNKLSGHVDDLRGTTIEDILDLQSRIAALETRAGRE